MRKIIEIKHGSHLYGTNTPESDQDFKAVYIPCREDILLQRIQKVIHQNTKQGYATKNTSEDTDIEILSVGQFFKLALEGQPVALEILFAPQQYWVSYEGITWNRVLDHRHLFLSKKVNTFVGYCMKQASKYGIKGSRLSAVRAVLELFKSLPANDKVKDHWPQIVSLTSMENINIVEGVGPKHEPLQLLEVCGRKVHPNVSVKTATDIYQAVYNAYGQRAILAESNDSIDWKALSHAVRVLDEAIELLKRGSLSFPSAIAPLLLQIKRGEIEYKIVATMIEEGMQDLLDAQAESFLPDEPDYVGVERLLMELHEEEVLGDR